MLTSYQRENQSLIADRIVPNDLTQIPKTYTDGVFDGKIGLDAEHPEDADYYQGWAFGHREYLCQQRNIELPNDF